MTDAASYRGGSGEPLVLVHGFTDTWRAWTPVLPALEAHHDVVAVTLPGHYGGPPWDPSVPMSMKAAADALERQIRAEGIDQAHLVGNSLGGWLCLELASRGRALSVVGVCPAGGWALGSHQERVIIRYFRRNQMLLRRFGRVLPTVARRERLRRLALRDLVAEPRKVGPDAALLMFEGARQCLIADDLLRLARTGQSFGDLGPIGCPVRVLYGSRDRLLRWPAYYTRMRGLLSDAEWVCLEGLGHLPMWDDPDVVANAILDHTLRARPSRSNSGSGA
jgi:pimeloyl-ACP methyl ester carboxylesterase